MSPVVYPEHWFSHWVLSSQPERRAGRRERQRQRQRQKQKKTKYHHTTWKTRRKTRETELKPRTWKVPQTISLTGNDISTNSSWESCWSQKKKNLFPWLSLLTCKSGPVDLAKQLPTTRRENTDASRETYEGGVRAPVETRLRPV